VGSPADIILNTAQSSAADLVVVGHRGLGYVVELAMGSVSHRVLLCATCSTLIVKGSPRKLQRVLVVVQGAEDMARIRTWLLTHPFRHTVELLVLSVVPRPLIEGSNGASELKFWSEAAFTGAQRLVENMAAVLNGSHYATSGRVEIGDPVASITREAEEFDLLLVSSHGRKGIQRFLLGSVSHSLVHRVARPVLLVR
jgi:nucleotide-binding universal stress UspA family protein